MRYCILFITLLCTACYVNRKNNNGYLFNSNNTMLTTMGNVNDWCIIVKKDTAFQIAFDKKIAFIINVDTLYTKHNDSTYVGLNDSLALSKKNVYCYTKHTNSKLIKIKFVVADSIQINKCLYRIITYNKIVDSRNDSSLKKYNITF